MKLLSLKNISKSFPGVKALDGVSLNIYSGEAMALIGENGAGKSTLIKIMGGIYLKDEGEIFLNEKPIEINSVKDSQNYNIAIIHQELNLIPNLSVAENIFIGREPVNKLGVINKKKLYDNTLELLLSLKIPINPNTKVSELSIANQQMIEIAKALSFNAEIIVMDEPTDALTDKEVRTLFDVITHLKKSGKGIVYISHRLPEIFEICEKITIFRDGTFIKETPTSEITENELIELMVGRKLSEQYPYIDTKTDECILALKGVTNEYVKDINLELYRGEILGIAGLVGAKRTELAKTIYGFYQCTGDINVFSEAKNHKNSSYVAYVSEDRKRDGLILSMNVRENICISSMPQIKKPLRIDKSKEKAIASSYKDAMNIKTPSLEQKVKNLSGGNQQKVSISRALMTNPEILILDEPTRGVDVGAKFEIYNLINDIKKQGKGIIVVSSEMAELIGICDRILVMHEGKKKGEIERVDFSQEKIMQLILTC